MYLQATFVFRDIPTKSKVYKGIKNCVKVYVSTGENCDAKSVCRLQQDIYHIQSTVKARDICVTLHGFRKRHFFLFLKVAPVIS